MTVRDGEHYKCLNCGSRVCGQCHQLLDENHSQEVCSRIHAPVLEALRTEEAVRQSQSPTGEEPAAEPAEPSAADATPAESTPLPDTNGEENAAREAAPPPATLGAEWPRALRRKLPDERESITHRFSIGGHEGYLTVGKYEDGSPGEIFIAMAKEDPTVVGVLSGFATMTSIALQHGIPLRVLVLKFAGTRFGPGGFTKNPQIPMTKSILDYVFTWLAIKFLPWEEREIIGVMPPQPQTPPLNPAEATFLGKVTGSNAADKVLGFVMPPRIASEFPRQGRVLLHEQDAPNCGGCGERMVRNGACCKCINCGATSGYS